MINLNQNETSRKNQIKYNLKMVPDLTTSVLPDGNSFRSKFSRSFNSTFNSSRNSSHSNSANGSVLGDVLDGSYFSKERRSQRRREARETKRRQRLTKVLREYSAEEEKWLLRAQQYRLDGKVNLALSCMKIKKDYEASISMLLHREGMTREDLEIDAAVVSSGVKSGVDQIGVEDELDGRYAGIDHSAVDSSGFRSDCSVAQYSTVDGKTGKNKRTPLRTWAKTIGRILKGKKKKPEKSPIVGLVVNLPPAPTMPLPPLPPLNTSDPERLPTPQPPPRRRSFFKPRHSASPSSKSVSASTSDSEASFDNPPASLRQFADELASHRRRNEAVAKLLSSASSAGDSDYDSDVLLEIEHRKWHSSTPTEELEAQELIKELVVDEVDAGFERRQTSVTPPAKPPRMMLAAAPARPLLLELTPELVPERGRPPTGRNDRRCVKQLIPEPGVDSAEMLLRQKRHKLRRLHETQQRMFEAMAAEEDEGICTEADATRSPVKPVKVAAEIKDHSEPKILLHLQQQYPPKEHQYSVPHKSPPPPPPPKPFIEDPVVFEQQMILESLAEGVCVPTYKRPSALLHRSLLSESTDAPEQEQPQDPQQPLQRRRNSRVSWDRNTDNWKLKREAAEKKMEEVELGMLKEFFGIEDEVLEPGEVGEVAEFRDRGTIRPV